MLFRSGLFVLAVLFTCCSIQAQAPYILRTETQGPADTFQLGFAEASAGDVDGDGVGDLILGAPLGVNEAPLSTYAAGHFANSQARGQVRLVSGATGADLRTWSALFSGSLFGYAVAGPGDLDGDGVPDVVIGAPRFGFTNLESAGRVAVVSGQTGQLLWERVGQTPGAGWGSSLSSIDDLDGDGVRDLVVGARFWNATATSPAGSAYVFSGATGSTIHTVTGVFANDQFGAAVLGLGDTSGDGIPDFAVGAPRPPCCFSGTWQFPGYVFLFSGADGSLLRSATGMAQGDAFGMSLASLGDIDGDGLDDLAVGVPHLDPHLAAPTGNPGEVVALSGASFGVLWTRSQGMPRDRFGFSLAALADVDGDGRRDLAVAVPGNLVGQGNALLSGATGTVLVTRPDFARSVASLPDIDGDGMAEVIAGVSGGLQGGAGYVRLYSGLSAVPLRTHAGDTGDDRFGDALAGIGDVDGDGVADHVVGVPGRELALQTEAGGIEVRSGADGSVIRTHPGLGTRNAHGISLARIEDLDGDGVAEYAAGGRPDLSLPAPQNLPVLVRSGATGAVILTLMAGTPTDAFGDTVADAGDVDGDGVTDIAVGAPRFGTGAPPEGQVHLFSGATGMVLRTYTGAIGMFLGAAIASAGDVDGDGIPDLAIGGPYTTGNVALAGVVRIYRGSDGTLLRERFGSTQGAAFGSALVNLGDVDGDGVDDLAVGAPANIAAGPSQQGIVRVLSGASGAVIRGLSAGAINDLFGYALASVGDWDGDGAADLAVGSPGERLPGGPAAGVVRVFSTATGAPLIVQAYPQPYVSGPQPYFGSAVASAGDVTGDGLEDLVVGAPGSAVGGVARNGTAFLLSYSGFPAMGGLFGQGCPQSDGRVPAIRIVGGQPTAQGNPRFGILLSNAVPQTGAYLAVGLSDQSWNGNPLPLDLAPLGLQPGCSLLVSVDALAPRTTGPGGIARVDIPIPANLGLLFFTAYAQWYVDEPGQPNRGAVSPGLRIQIF
jgi:hypothetical protein